MTPPPSPAPWSPGTYTVRLIDGRKSPPQPLIVVMDPRV